MKIFWKYLKFLCEFYINFSKNFEKTCEIFCWIFSWTKIVATPQAPPVLNFTLRLWLHPCDPFEQRFSTCGTRAICGTLTNKLWHFAFIFMWHSWSNNIKKMALRTSDYSLQFRTGTLKLRWEPFLEIPQNL